MIRLLFLTFKIALVTAVAVWLANRPGDVIIHWQGYEVTTSVGVMVLVVLAMLGVLMLAYHLWRALIGIPGSLSLAHLTSRRRRGYLALTQGLVAVAAGDAMTARKFARKAEKLLNEPPLTLLLQAQAAQLNGDENAANRYFSAMLERPEMSFLGVRGLLTQAIKQGDTEGALALARKAYVQQPKTEWVLTALLDLECRAGHWDAALNLLTAGARQGFIPPDRSRRLRATLWLAQSRKALATGDKNAALYHARRAHELVPGFVPATEDYARLLLDGGKGRVATKVIERTWRQHPHPALVPLYIAAEPDLVPLRQVKRLERLRALDPAGLEGPLALATTALEAKLWGEARAELMSTLAKSPDARVYRVLAELEAKEKGDAAAAHQWREKAALASPEATWICTTCQTQHVKWQPSCSECSAFGTLEWHLPTTIARLIPPALMSPSS